MITYTVTVSREEPWWVAIVEGLAGGATESRRLDQLEVEVRDLISGLTDASGESFALEWNHSLSPELDRPRASASELAHDTRRPSRTTPKPRSVR